MLVCELKQAIVAIKPIDLMIPIKLYSFSVFFAIVENKLDQHFVFNILGILFFSLLLFMSQADTSSHYLPSIAEAGPFLKLCL